MGQDRDVGTIGSDPSGDEATGLDSFKTPDGQAFGMLQELWSELVMNVDKSRQSNMFSLFGEASKDSYEEYWERVSENDRELKVPVVLSVDYYLQTSGFPGERQLSLRCFAAWVLVDTSF